MTIPTMLTTTMATMTMTKDHDGNGGLQRPVQLAGTAGFAKPTLAR
jgi:hypothetical protein